MTTHRILLQGPPRNGYIVSLTFTDICGPPDEVFVYRANPGLILAPRPGGDKDTVEETFVTYRRTGKQTIDGVEIYSCLS